jgi:hypothetical protein
MVERGKRKGGGRERGKRKREGKEEGERKRGHVEGRGERKLYSMPNS